MRGKRKEAVFAKNKEWYSGSSCSSGEERWLGGQDKELKKFRTQVELLSEQQGVWRDQGSTRGTNEETKGKWRRRRIARKSLMSKRTAWTWFSRTEEIEKKRAELLPEHQMQKKVSEAAGTKKQPE